MKGEHFVAMPQLEVFIEVEPLCTLSVEREKESAGPRAMQMKLFTIGLEKLT